MGKSFESWTIRAAHCLPESHCRPRFRSLCILSSIVALGLGSSLLQAEPVELSGRLDNRFSDNTRESADNEESDVESRVSLQISHKTDPGQCRSALSANLGYGVYLNDTYDPQIHASGDWFGACDITERLTWEVRDSLSDIVPNSRGNATPDNTTRRNTFSTGPRYTINLGPVDMIDLAATYENTTYKKQDEDENQSQDEEDSNSITGSVAWNHLFSQTLSGGLRFAAEETSYDSGEDSSRQTVTGFFSKQFVTTVIGGSLGATYIETTTERTTQESDGLVGNLSIQRQITPSATAYANLKRELTDRQQDYDVNFNGAIFTIEQSTPVEVTSVRAGLNQQFSDSSGLDTSIVADRSTTLSTNNNEDRIALQGEYYRPLSGLLQLTANVSYAYLSYDDDGTTDNLINLSAGLTYQVTRRLDVSGGLGHNRRTSDQGSREYDENWISLGLEYKFWK